MISAENRAAPLFSHRSEALYPSRLVAVLLVLAVLVPACVFLYIAAGAPVAVPPAIATVIGVGAWLTTLHSRSDGLGGSSRDAREEEGKPAAFQLYIGTIVVLITQHTEEWLRHMPHTVMLRFPGAYPPGVVFDDRLLISAFPLAGSALFLFGALAYYHRLAIGNGASWILFTWAIVSGAAHFVYPLVGIGSIGYVGGMITAPLAIACGVCGVRRLLTAGTDTSNTGLDRAQWRTS